MEVTSMLYSGEVGILKGCKVFGSTRMCHGTFREPVRLAHMSLNLRGDLH